MRNILIAVALASAVGLAATAADTSIVFKPTPEQVKTAHALENKKCPVTGDQMGRMLYRPLYRERQRIDIGPSGGIPEIVLYKGEAIQLCCASCEKKFAQDPAGFLSKAQEESNPISAK